MENVLYLMHTELDIQVLFSEMMRLVKGLLPDSRVG